MFTSYRKPFFLISDKGEEDDEEEDIGDEDLGHNDYEKVHDSPSDADTQAP